MAVDVSKLKEQAGRAMSGFTSGQKAMLGIAALATLVGAYLFMSMAGTQSYAALYSNLQASDASAVTQQLDSEGVPYKLGNGGATILVPQDKVYQLRLDMSSKGLPTDGAPGYALLDKTGITTSEFRQRIDYQRALEGELSKTIGAIDGVTGATVHLVIPQQDLFVNDAQHPSASVLVKTSRSLGSGPVQSIVHLVASSVEGLTPDNVTVADDKGRMLAAPGADGAAGAITDARTEQTASYQNQVARSIEDLLTPITGPGKAKVQVAATLDFSKKQTTSEAFSQPAGGPLAVNTSSSTETFSGAGTPVGGTLGTGAATTPLGTTGSGGDSTYSKGDGQTQNAVNKTTEVIDGAPGAVQKLSVAVAVDASVNVGAQEIQDLVKAAVGFDTTRGDTLSVQKLVFDPTAADAANQALGSSAAGAGSSPIGSILQTGGAVLIVALVLFFAWRSSKKAAIARYPMAIPLDPVADATSRGLPAAGASDGAGAAVRALPEQDALAAAIDVQREQTQGQIVDLIDRQPDDVAQVLRGWLADKK